MRTLVRAVVPRRFRHVLAAAGGPSSGVFGAQDDERPAALATVIAVLVSLPLPPERIVAHGDTGNSAWRLA